MAVQLTVKRKGVMVISRVIIVKVNHVDIYYQKQRSIFLRPNYFIN